MVINRTSDMEIQSNEVDHIIIQNGNEGNAIMDFNGIKYGNDKIDLNLLNVAIRDLRVQANKNAKGIYAKIIF
jgi:aminoglycoside phosphotransferase (APT) family kinase protein